MRESNDEILIHNVIQVFVAGWNAANAIALASAFSEDADFTAITGLRAHGRELIGHATTRFFRRSIVAQPCPAQLTASASCAPMFAALDVSFELRNEDGNPVFGIRQTSAGLIVTKEGENWSIAVFRNMVPFQRPMAGTLEQSIMKQTGPCFRSENATGMEYHRARTSPIVTCLVIQARPRRLRSVRLPAGRAIPALH